MSLWDHWSRFNSTNYATADARSYAKRLSGSTFYWPIHSLSPQIPPRYALGNPRADDDAKSYTWLAMPHAAPTAVLQELMTDWWTAIAPIDKKTPSKIDDRQGYSTFLHAITTVRCSQPQNLLASNTTVQFPSLEGRFDFATPLNMDIANVSLTPVDHLRFQWLHLPNTFGAISIGGLFESAWTSNASRTVFGCSLQAGWVPVQATTDEYSFWTGWYPWNITFGGRIPFFNAVAPGQPIGKTNGRIALGDEWLQLLTPKTNIKIAGSRLTNPSTIESMFEAAGIDNDDSAWTGSRNLTDSRVQLIEAIMSSVVTDGLSRYGSHQIFDNASAIDTASLKSYQKLRNFNKRILQGKNALQAPPLIADSMTTLHVDLQITGFAFRHSLAGYLATAVLVAHLFLAIGHMIWLVGTRQSSGCWSLVTEIVNLAYNSRTTTPALDNTGAGIDRGSTFGQIARILVRASDSSTTPARVELVFDDSIDSIEDSKDLEMTTGTTQQEPELGIKQIANTSSSFGLTGLFDERAHTTSTDALISKSDVRERAFFTQVEVDKLYG